jgi:hypothetical protein
VDLVNGATVEDAVRDAGWGTIANELGHASNIVTRVRPLRAGEGWQALAA